MSIKKTFRILSEFKFFAQISAVMLFVLFLTGATSKKPDSVIFLGYFGQFVELSLNDLSVLAEGFFPRDQHTPQKGLKYSVDLHPTEQDYWSPWLAAFHRTSSRLFVVFPRDLKGKLEGKKLEEELEDGPLYRQVFVYDSDTFELVETRVFGGLGSMDNILPGSGKEVIFQYRISELVGKEEQPFMVFDILNAKTLQKLKTHKIKFIKNSVGEWDVPPLFFHSNDHYDSISNTVHGRNGVIHLNDKPAHEKRFDFNRGRPSGVLAFSPHEPGANDWIDGKNLLMRINKSHPEESHLWAYDFKHGKRLSPPIKTSSGWPFFGDGGKTIINVGYNFNSKTRQRSSIRNGSVQVFDVASGKMIRDLNVPELVGTDQLKMRMICDPQRGNYLFYLQDYRKVFALNLLDGTFREILSNFQPMTDLPCLAVDR